jgi:putative peptidoglycan lipid II flippase
MLPISLFGMAISAAELPDMSADAVKSVEERAKALRARLEAGLSRLSFFVVPSAVAFLFLGDLISGVLLETGRFTAADSRLTWYILIGSAVALTAQTSGRLYSSAFYALKDTRTPLKFATLRVGLGIALGYYAVRVLPGQLGLPEHLGVVFITVTTGFTAWVEMLLLRHALKADLGEIPRQGGQLARVWGAAMVAGVVALGLKVWLAASFGAREVAEWGGSVLAPPKLPVLVTSAGLLGLFCAVYGLVALALGVAQARAVVKRVLRR